MQIMSNDVNSWALCVFLVYATRQHSRVRQSLGVNIMSGVLIIENDRYEMFFGSFVRQIFVLGKYPNESIETFITF